MIKRPTYLKKLATWQDRDIIKVITGLRRSGKSTLFLQFQKQLRASGIPTSQIISINLEDPRFQFPSALDLYNYILSRVDGRKKSYIFLDEIQTVPEFQKAVDGLFLKKNLDLYITGSNANLLSGELATLLSGRYIEIPIYPLSFREFLSGLPAADQLNPYTAFLHYLQDGGMPGVFSIANLSPIEIPEYLDGILATVVYKDVMTRGNFKDKLLADSILKFIFSNIGSPTSIKKISDTLTSQHLSTSNHTVERYLSAFIESFIISKCEQYDIKGKAFLSRNYKYYCTDLGLRNHFLGQAAGQDMGHLLENAVYLELIRRGYQVFTGRADDLEIDFVAKKPTETIYYQVALSAREPSTLERELRPLRQTHDFYPRVLLTLDQDLDTEYSGIAKKNVVNWLLQP